MRSGGVRYLVVPPDCQRRLLGVESGGTCLVGRAEYTSILGQLKLDISFNNVIPAHQPSPYFDLVEFSGDWTHRKSPPRASIT
jgi:hypothetical protein